MAILNKSEKWIWNFQNKYESERHCPLLEVMAINENPNEKVEIEMIFMILTPGNINLYKIFRKREDHVRIQEKQQKQ